MSGHETPLSTPSSTAAHKKALPFKKTRTSSIVAPEAKSTSQGDNEDDDALKLFSHSNKFFKDQERERKERAVKKEKEKELKLKKAAEEEKEIESEASAQLVREAEQMSSPRKQRRNSELRDDFKRRCFSNSDDENNECLTSSRRPSLTPNKSSGRSRRDMSARTSTSTPGSSRKKMPGPVISLVDSDDEDLTKPPTLAGKGKVTMRAEMSAEDNQVDDGMDEDIVEEDELTARYVRQAKERANAHEKERLADATAELLTQPRMPYCKPLNVRIKLMQPMRLVKDSWVQKTINQDTTPYSQADMEAMFFTWKGNKIYDSTTLASLGINPPERNGYLYPSWENARDGYDGWDKVLFEAWSPDLYEEYQLEKERERKRVLGELDDESEQEPEPGMPQPTAKKIRLFLKSKDCGDIKVSVTPETPIGHLMQAFRTQRKIPQDKTIEIFWEGKVWDPDSTVEDADLADMDKVDVLVK